MSGYVAVAAVFVAGLLLVTVAMVVRRLLAPHAPHASKLTTYESGVDPVGEGWAQTKVRYFVYAFLYVVFAVDAVYLFPWAHVLAIGRHRHRQPGRDGHLHRCHRPRTGARGPPWSAQVGVMEWVR